MRRLTYILLTAFLLLTWGGVSVAADTETEDEWTVLFYFCGSDLESKYGYATGNLAEISEKVFAPYNIAPIMTEAYEHTPTEGMEEPFGKVNILLETGGSKEWKAGEDTGFGLENGIDSNALQRWEFNTFVETDEEAGYPYGYNLVESLPLSSMADPDTLADFIRWGTSYRPAKKYALVLWDHGDGARSGLFIDELFDLDEMYLYELKQAMADGGAHFDTIILDACLMANLETAWNLKDSADWMVASEEVVPGEGTAVGEWLQGLLCYPEADGEWLGRLVCDTTLVKYANLDNSESRDNLTLSLTDLSKIETLTEAAESLFEEMGIMLSDYPEIGTEYARYFSQAVEYGAGEQNMRDIGSFVYDTDLAVSTEHKLRNAVIQALADAVVYCVRGPGRTKGRGLSLCYPATFTDEQLDNYAKNFPMPHYLAYIDAVSDWTAPDWVYESTKRLPSVDDMEEYQVEVRKTRTGEGMPGFIPSDNILGIISYIHYTLYRLNEETGETVRLGHTDCRFEVTDGSFDLIYRASDPMHWPSIDGQLVCMDLIQNNEYQHEKLYNVPVMLNEKPGMLRMGRYANYASDEAERINKYEVYGVWEGYEQNSILLNRSVIPLSSVVGQEYELLYPIDGTGDDGGDTLYENSEPLTMYRSLEVEEISLPAGTYYLEYEMSDVFERAFTLDRIEIKWDGETMTFPGDDEWESDEWIRLTASRKE